MVGDEDPVISDLFVKADGIFCRRICALAYRCCMAMCFVPVHFSSPLMRDAAFFLLRGRFLSVPLPRRPLLRERPAQRIFESRRRESVLDERESPLIQCSSRECAFPADTTRYSASEGQIRRSFPSPGHVSDERRKPLRSITKFFMTSCGGFPCPLSFRV